VGYVVEGWRRGMGDGGGIVVTRKDGTVHSGNVTVCKQYNFIT
jgi:hypothetical protein